MKSILLSRQQDPRARSLHLMQFHSQCLWSLHQMTSKLSHTTMCSRIVARWEASGSLIRTIGVCVGYRPIEDPVILMVTEYSQEQRAEDWLQSICRTLQAHENNSLFVFLDLLCGLYVQLLTCRCNTWCSQLPTRTHLFHIFYKYNVFLSDPAQVKDNRLQNTCQN